MKRLVLIGGTGAGALVPADAVEQGETQTRWGSPSASLLCWQRNAVEVFFLARHGRQGGIAPHRVNYRANIAAARAVEPDAVIAINAVGGITAAAWPGRIVLPAQIIDYTWGREHTFCDGDGEPLRHVEFDPPFDEPLRQMLVARAGAAGVNAYAGGTYGVTQGPRLETAAEIDRLAADGCDVVGMTAMPEAALAREAGLRYAMCAVVVNRAAGRLPAQSPILAQIEVHLAGGMAQLSRILEQLFARPD